MRFYRNTRNKCVCRCVCMWSLNSAVLDQTVSQPIQEINSPTQVSNLFTTFSPTQPPSQQIPLPPFETLLHCSFAFYNNILVRTQLFAFERYRGRLIGSLLSRKGLGN